MSEKILPSRCRPSEIGNAAVARVGATVRRGERGFALLTKHWAALQHITADPDRTTEITCAALVLTQFEHKYIS